MQIHAAVCLRRRHDFHHAKGCCHGCVPGRLTGAQIGVIHRQCAVIVLHEAAFQASDDRAGNDAGNLLLLPPAFHESQITQPVLARLPHHRIANSKRQRSHRTVGQLLRRKLTFLLAEGHAEQAAGNFQIPLEAEIHHHTDTEIVAIIPQARNHFQTLRREQVHITDPGAVRIFRQELRPQTGQKAGRNPVYVEFVAGGLQGQPRVQPQSLPDKPPHNPPGKDGRHTVY